MMGEMLRIERVMDLVLECLTKAKSALTMDQLERRVSRRLKGEPLREGDFRAAVSQLMDGGRVHSTADGKFRSGKKKRPSWALT
jgi:hypothetical protein